MTYVPQVGDTVRVVIVGMVNQIDPTTGVYKVGSAQTGSVNFKLTDTIVNGVEKVTPPERWHLDDWVLDANGVVYRRTGRGNWTDPEGKDVFDIAPKRPLTLLVRDGVAQ